MIDNFVSYTYDGVGNTKTMTTANGTQTTQYEYNKQNRLRKIIDPMGMVEEYTDYDNNNNLLTKKDRNGNITTNTYNLLNQVERVSVKPAGSTTNAPEFIEYKYGLTGLKTQEKNENLTIDFVYDSAGRLTKQMETAVSTPGASVVKNYNYDVHNNRKGFSLVQGGVTRQNLTYDYNSMNRLEKVYDSGVLQAVYGYDLNGNRSSLTYNPSGITTTYEYNRANLVTKLTNRRSGTVLSSYNYTYLLDGNQDSKKDHENVQTAYVYDDLGRLKKETELVPAGARGQTVAQTTIKDYTFDFAGNRKTMAVAVTGGAAPESYTTSYQYDKNNRLLTEKKLSGATTHETEYYYDPNGNQVSKLTNSFSPAGNGQAEVGIFILGETSSSSFEAELRTYDAFNRLVGVDSDVSAVYAYRPDGLRLSKTVNGQTTSHIWDNGYTGTPKTGGMVSANIVMELDGSGNVTSRYVHGINLIKGLEGQNERNYLFNAHGDVVQLANPQGSIAKNYYYDAFGVEIDPDPNDQNPWRYCGGIYYWDRETETYYVKFRLFNPKNGRWTQEDPIRDGLNWYTYCVNNPVNRFDPWGLVDVMTKYIVDKNKGSIKTTLNDKQKVTGITISMNDKTRTYTVDQKDSKVKNINEWSTTH